MPDRLSPDRRLSKLGYRAQDQYRRRPKEDLQPRPTVAALFAQLEDQHDRQGKHERIRDDKAKDVRGIDLSVQSSSCPTEGEEGIDKNDQDNPQVGPEAGFVSDLKFAGPQV